MAKDKASKTIVLRQSPTLGEFGKAWAIVQPKHRSFTWKLAEVNRLISMARAARQS